MVDSPGGSTDGLSESTDLLAQAKQKKRIVVQSLGIIGSAAYQLSSQAHRIYAGRTHLIGSLGARLQLLDFSKMFERLGVRVVNIDGGSKFKSAGAVGSPISDEQVEYFEGIVDVFIEDFKQAVQRGRGMTRATVDRLFDGAVHTGEAALSLRLIDGVQAIRKTMQELATGRQQARQPARRRGTRAEVTQPTTQAERRKLVRQFDADHHAARLRQHDARERQRQEREAMAVG